MNYFFLDDKNPRYAVQIEISNIRDSINEPRLLHSTLVRLRPQTYQRIYLLIKVCRRDRLILVAPAKITDDESFGYSSLFQR